MTSHFSKYHGLKVNVTTLLTRQYIERMMVRQPVDRTHNMHPSVKKRWN